MVFVERKIGEPATTPSVEELIDIFDRSTEGFLIQSHGKPIFVNRQLYMRLGYPSREATLALNNTMSIVHPDDQELVRDYARRRIAGKAAPAEYEVRLLHFDGTPVWMMCHAYSTLWRGEPVIAASFYDISDRKALESANEGTEALFSTVFEMSPMILTLTRFEDGTFVRVNKAFSEMIGYSSEEALGKTSVELGIYPTHENRAEKFAALKEGVSILDAEMHAKNRNGEDIYLQLSSVRLDIQGEDLLLVIGRDLMPDKKRKAELRASKEEAEFANRSKSEFLANISHELRTPLNAILGFAEAIESKMFGELSDRYAEYAGDIHRSGTHLLEIISEILDLSKIEAGKMELDEERVNVGDIIEQCVRLVGARADEADVVLEVRMPGEPIFVNADETRIKQIFINLLSNAVKFTPKGGEIIVSGKVLGDGTLKFDVTDNGIGMDEKEIEHALSPFGQVVSAMTREHEGTGLGLPLVQQFVRLHGGEMTVQSEKGRGTTVCVRLPAERVCP